MSKNQEPLFIYHGDCFDGFTSAWIFSKVFPKAEFYPAKYGNVPLLTLYADRTVWVVDFSFPEEIMQIIAHEVKTLRWFDHHQTAEKYFDEIPKYAGVMNKEKCGCRLLYDYLYPALLRADEEREAVPIWLIDYVEDRDLWKKELTFTEQVSAWIAAQPMTFAAWDGLARTQLREVATCGQAVQTYINQYGIKARKEATFENICGHEVPVVNMPYMNCSEHVGKLLEENPSRAFAAGYFRRADRMWQFSLRSEDKFDVAYIAEQFGGGGHKNAAGFAVSELPWEF